MQSNFIAEKALGYQQLLAAAVDAGAAFANVPDGTVLIIITAEGQAVRWRDDGVLPTAAIGQPLAVGQVLSYTARNAKSLRFISQTAGAIINATFYGQAI